MEDDVLPQHGQGFQDEGSKQVHVDVVAGAVEFSVQEETMFLPSGKVVTTNRWCLKCCVPTRGGGEV